MIKLRRMEQRRELSKVLDSEADAESLDIAQYANGTIGVSRLNRTGKVTVHTYIRPDGESNSSGQPEEEGSDGA